MKTLLLVEDDRTTAEMLARDLTAHGYVVAHVGDAKGAMTLILEGARPDAILSDVVLPDADGVCLLDLLKSLGCVRVAMTALGDRDFAAVEARAQLASVPLLRKPFEAEDFDRLVRGDQP